MSVASGTLSAMIDQDALAGLDEVRWAELTHAYGPALDVPELLRALRSSSPEEHDGALGTLYTNIFHQGSRYQATAYAVPFLARLALDPATPDRPGVVGLLAAVAIGYDATHLPDGVDTARWRADVERMRTADPAEELRKIDEWVEAAADEHERRSREVWRSMYVFEEERRAALDELAAYDAVRAELPRLRRLLTDDDPDLRAAAAHLLAWFPEEAPDSVAALRALLDAETVPGVAANAIVSLGLLADADSVPRLRARLDGSEPLLRWAAAVALARLGVAEPGVIGALAAASADPPAAEAGPEVNFQQGDLRAYASKTLVMLADRLPPEAIDAVLEGLSKSSETAAFPMAGAACTWRSPTARSVRCRRSRS